MRTKAPNRKTLLCIIHTHPKYKIIKEHNAWQDWLLVRYGVESCKELNDKELKEVIAIFNERISDRDYIKREDRGEKMSGTQERKIAVLLSALGWSEGGYFNFIKRQIGEYKIPQSLSKAEATSIIIGLQKIVGER